MANRYKNVTVVITMKNFGIDTKLEPKDAVLDALELDLEAVASIKKYFTDPSITLEVVNESVDK